MSRPIKLAVFGLGWVATHRHLPALRANPAFEIVGVVDRREDLAKHWAARIGAKRFAAAGSLSDVGWIDEVEAIDVVTAPMAHFALIREGLEAGKHVLTEKPFAMNLDEGRQLLATAQKNRRELGIVHNFQFARSMDRLLEDLRRGSLGTVRSIVATQWGNPLRRLPDWYEQLPAGLFYDESPHLLYLLRRLCPGGLRLVTVDSCPSSMGLRTPASVDVSYRTHNSNGEIPVSMNCRFEAPLSEWQLVVLGDKAAGAIDIFRDIYLRLPNDGSHNTRTVLRTSWCATFQHWKGYVRNGPKHLAGRLLYGNEEVFRRFAGAVKHDRPLQDIAAADAFDVLSMQHEILARMAKPFATSGI